MKTKALFIFLFAFANSFAQTQIKGIVTDKSGMPLPGANIYIENTYDGTSSISNGTFSFSTSEQGKHRLIVDFIGYEQQIASLNLNGSQIDLSFKLKEEFNQLDAVNITAGTFEAGDKKKSIAMTPLDIVTTPSASGDIYGAIQAMPGTTTVGESGKLYVKGGDSRESKTFIDGTLVYTPYTSQPPNTSVRGRFNPFMFSGTMFSTGGYSAEYGQALSGILALKTNEMPVEDQLNISLLSLGGGASGTKTFNKSSITASFNYYNLKPYMQVAPQYTTWNKEPKGINGELSYRLKTGKSGLLKFYTQISESNLSMAQSNIEERIAKNNFNLENKNVFINSSWTGELNHNWILTAATAYTHNADYIALDTANYNEYLQGGHTKLMVSRKLNAKVKLKIGAEWYSKEFKNEFQTANSSINNGLNNNMLTAFVESEIYASKKFVTRLGARMEYSNYLNLYNVAPRFSAAYKIAKKSQLSLSYGMFYQNADDDYLLYTNKLNFERADHYTLNYQYEKDKRVIRSELFYKNYANLTKFTDQPFYLETGYNNSGYGNAYGFDLFYRDNKSITNGQFWVSYSYIKTEKNYMEFPELSSPRYSSPHNINIVYKHWIQALRSQIGASYKYASSRVYNNPNTEKFNDEKTLAYQTLDMNWSYLFRENVIFYASVSNVLGFKQHFGYNYSDKPAADGSYSRTPILPGSKRFYLVGCFITLSHKGDLNQLDKIN